jgi:hypothetical protein
VLRELPVSNASRTSSAAHTASATHSSGAAHASDAAHSSEAAHASRELPLSGEPVGAGEARGVDVNDVARASSVGDRAEASDVNDVARVLGAMHGAAQKGGAQVGGAQVMGRRPALGTEKPARPLVRVRVGRIEVSAHAPPSVPVYKPPVQPRPRLSLGEYLKRRRGGGGE